MFVCVCACELYLRNYVGYRIFLTICHLLFQSNDTMLLILYPNTSRPCANETLWYNQNQIKNVYTIKLHAKMRTFCQN